MPILVYINQQPAGTLTVSQDGLYTVFEAEAPGTGGLVRLWAHGEGKSACLGVMEPRDSGLYLRRRFSRRELAAFPGEIAFVSDRERDGGEQTEAPQREEPEKAPENRERQGKRETDHKACPWPAEPPEEGLLWYRRPDGSLVSFDGVSSLLAIPAELRAPGGRMTQREIEGKKYLVFRY